MLQLGSSSPTSAGRRHSHSNPRGTKQCNQVMVTIIPERNAMTPDKKPNAAENFSLRFSQRIKKAIVDISYAAPQAHGIVNVALHLEYFPGIIFIFSQGRNDFYHVYD
jgi:hypothetical protein